MDAAGFQTQEIIMGGHAGTHVDAPAHVLSQGDRLDELPVMHFFGPACCIHVPRGASEAVTLEDLQPFSRGVGEADFVLLHTGWSRFWGEENYFFSHPCLTEDAALWLAEQNIKGLGTDMPSVDSQKNAHLPIHHQLLRKGISLIENLTAMEKLPYQGFLFSCLPLKLQNGDGSPVRAVAIIL